MISEFLNLFDQTTQTFKEFIYDRTRSENDPVNNIQDINKGALHNAIEWNNRWKTRILEESNLNVAKGLILDAFGELFGIRRISTDDEAYRQYILDILFPPYFTLPYLQAYLSNAEVSECYDIGFFLDSSFLNNSNDNDIIGSNLIAESNTVYIFWDTKKEVDFQLIRRLYRIKPAGIQLYTKAKKSGIYDYLFLNDSTNGFIQDDFFLGGNPDFLPPPQAQEYLYLDDGGLNSEFLGIEV